MCSGQTAESTATAATPHTGAMKLQLAPSFLDHMDECTTHDTVPPQALVQATAGLVNAKGDCAWSNGVSCHFHVGAEFVDSQGPRPDVGELHCIFPSGEPKSPFVYGMHFTCASGTAVSHDHTAHEQQACGAKLLSTVATTMGSCHPRCCEDGTLTTPAADREHAGTLDVRPDFRICTATAELDCSMFAGMVGHAANAPHFGPPVDTGI
jgi:hypothetical protein